MAAINIIAGTVTNRRDHVPARKIVKRALVIISALFAAMLALGLTISSLNGQLTNKRETLPACQFEDGSGNPGAPCYWDADTQGNRKGRDVLHIDGQTFVEVK